MAKTTVATAAAAVTPMSTSVAMAVDLSPLICDDEQPVAVLPQPFFRSEWCATV